MVAPVLGFSIGLHVLVSSTMAWQCSASLEQRQCLKNRLLPLLSSGVVRPFLMYIASLDAAGRGQKPHYFDISHDVLLKHILEIFHFILFSFLSLQLLSVIQQRFDQYEITIFTRWSWTPRE